MAVMKITEAQAAALLKARDSVNRKSLKKTVMAEVHRQHPEIGQRKITVFIENPSNPLYLVIRDKNTKMPLEDGRGEAPVATPVATPAAPVATPVKAAKAAKAAPAKAAKAAPVKAAKAPAKAAKPTLRTADMLDVRITVNGVRTRIGYAKDEAAKKRMIAKYKRENGIA